MKNINLYFDFEMTSLSRDGQPISLGIVSDKASRCHINGCKGMVYPPCNECMSKGNDIILAKSFYAEFTDFDIDRCDDWVKENVVKKLRLKEGGKDPQLCSLGGIIDVEVSGNFKEVKERLILWLAQFKDYQITFVGDCVTWDWLHMLDLIAEWNYVCSKAKYKCHSCSYKNGDKNCINYPLSLKAGLPKLPKNITPVPQDLNDLIASKKNISIQEAFDLSREGIIKNCSSCEQENHLICSCCDKTIYSGWENKEENKHNALWDAKIIKEIYNIFKNKLKI